MISSWALLEVVMFEVRLCPSKMVVHSWKWRSASITVMAAQAQSSSKQLPERCVRDIAICHANLFPIVLSICLILSVYLRDLDLLYQVNDLALAVIDFSEPSNKRCDQWGSVLELLTKPQKMFFSDSPIKGRHFL